MIIPITSSKVKFYTCITKVMKMKSLTCLTLTFLILVQGFSRVSSARILCVFPALSKSHAVVFTALTTELARQGHELVVVSPFPLDKAPANYTDIDLMPSLKEFHEEFLDMNLFTISDMWTIQQPLVMYFMGLMSTEKTLEHPQVKQLMKDNRGFDLVIVEDFFTHALYAFAEYFKAPLILISSLDGLPSTHEAVGNPQEISYVPSALLPYTDGMSFTQRMHTFLFNSFIDLSSAIYYMPRQEALRRQYFGDSTPSVWDLKYTPSLVLLNSHFTLNCPRPQLPSVQEVGGMQVKRITNPLSKDIKDFLDNAKEGAIYFSMGSNLRSKDMPENMKNGLLAAFSQISHRVLMKWDDEKLPGNPANIMTKKWLPQQDVLAHPNVRVFITHGGLLSAQEAAYHGVPLIGIPVFADQMLNMKRASQKGYAILLEMKNITKESVLWALDKSLHDKSILNEASRRSEAFRDQPETPLERAVFWTEYVLRHNGAPHLRSAALNLNWYQRNLIDVMALFLVLGLALTCIIHFSLRLCCDSKPTRITNKNKKD